jgi:hypothetical protein
MVAEMNSEQARFEMDADDFEAYLSSQEARLNERELA